MPNLIIDNREFTTQLKSNKDADKSRLQINKNTREADKSMLIKSALRIKTSTSDSAIKNN